MHALFCMTHGLCYVSALWLNDMYFDYRIFTSVTYGNWLIGGPHLKLKCAQFDVYNPPRPCASGRVDQVQV